MLRNYYLGNHSKQNFLFVIRVNFLLPNIFRKKGVPRNFAKFTGKHLCQSFFFNKVDRVY